MSKSTNQAVAPVDTLTAPVVVASPEQAADLAFGGERRRPVLAINAEGELVVCCRRTARKHGWEVQGALFQRTRSGKTRIAKVALDAKDGTIKQARRGADQPEAQRAGAVHIADAVHDALINSLLGTK
jgi:hypothetical protein